MLSTSDGRGVERRYWFAMTPPRSSIRVLITDDEPLFAETIMSVLGSDERIEVVGHASDGIEAIRLVESLRPDLVLMDISMPGMGGIEATKRIKELAPQLPVLILTTSSDEDDVRRATAAGAAGYLTKDAASDVVATIVEIATLARAFTATSSVAPRS